MHLKNLHHSTARWLVGEIDEVAYAGLYFLHWQAESHGKRFASRRKKTDPHPDPNSWFAETAAMESDQVRSYLLDFFGRYQFYGVRANAQASMAAWLAGSWPLILCERIPDSREVLDMQVAGRRPVTVLSAWPRMLAPVLTKPNAFAFMVHDLEHGWKFFHDPASHDDQRRLFRRLRDALESGRFDSYLSDPVFSEKFDYLVSDMNTHVMHASQFLRAILVEFHLRREGSNHPNQLSGDSLEQVSTLLASLFGNEWIREVEVRMIDRMQAGVAQ